MDHSVLNFIRPTMDPAAPPLMHNNALPPTSLPQGWSDRGTVPDPASSASTAVKRACDACHRRKVKCIAGADSRPCKNCGNAGLTCTYNAVPQKKGPKGSRAKVISELRQSQLAAQQHSPDAGFALSGAERRHGILSLETITLCVDYFFANIYPTQPILHRQKVGETIGQMDTNKEAYCLAVSLCAYMMIQPNMNLPPRAFEGEGLDMPPQSSTQIGCTLLQEAVRVRKGIDYVECPTIWSAITSFFLFGSYFCLDKQNSAWFYLREATTLAQTLGMHDELQYNMPDVVESSRRRRLYWLLFITERAYALQHHRPLTLHATINLPTLDDDSTETVQLNGFLHLVNLFRPFDDTFVGLWNKARTGCTTTWLAQLQQQLCDALPQYLHCTESQAVDLRCTQQWLRMMVWQLSISQGFLSSAAADKAMSFHFPIEVSRDLLATTARFSQAAMEVHGIGLIEKLFDIACTLTDVISCVPADTTHTSVSPRHYLHQLTTLIASLRGGSERYMPLLASKIHDTLPCAPQYGLSSFLPDHLYDEGGANSSSNPSSGVSTPFGSAPCSVSGPPPPPTSSAHQHQVSGQGYFGFGAAEAAARLGSPTSFPIVPIVDGVREDGGLRAMGRDLGGFAGHGVLKIEREGSGEPLGM